MRTLAHALLLALALAAPLAGAAVASCSGTCTITAATAGFTPAVLQLASGASIVWTSTDINHVMDETKTTGGDACFDAIAAGHGSSDPVRFDLVAGALVATQADATMTCTNAVVTPAGVALPYHCLLHPGMRGSIVVT